MYPSSACRVGHVRSQARRDGLQLVRRLPLHAGAYVVNCAISPLVSLDDWPFHVGGGLVSETHPGLLAFRGWLLSISLATT